MTERQIELVKSYGPRFYRRSNDIMDELFYLSADAASVLTDKEWKDCAEAVKAVITELKKAKEVVVDRMIEAGIM